MTDDLDQMRARRIDAPRRGWFGPPPVGQSEFAPFDEPPDARRRLMAMDPADEETQIEGIE